MTDKDTVTRINASTPLAGTSMTFGQIIESLIEAIRNVEEDEREAEENLREDDGA